MQVICKNKLLMEIDICFHNLKQRFNSSEGFYYSSYTKTSFWFLWPASDALLQSIKSRILPALSWMHHVCSASQSRCSKRRNEQHFVQSGEVFLLRKCFPNDAFTSIIVLTNHWACIYFVISSLLLTDFLFVIMYNFPNYPGHSNIITKLSWS